MLLNCSTTPRDSATGIEKASQKGERERPNRSVVKSKLALSVPHRRYSRKTNICLNQHSFNFQFPYFVATTFVVANYNCALNSPIPICGIENMRFKILETQMAFKIITQMALEIIAQITYYSSNNFL